MPGCPSPASDPGRATSLARVIDADNDGAPDDINSDGRINDADKTAVRTSLIDDTHRARLFIHTWTFRNWPEPVPAQ